VKNLKVMVVDDNTKVMFAFQTLLETENCLIIEATSGVEALKKFSSKKPKAVFLDISLPDVNGLEILQKIREKSPTVPVIIITGVGSPDLRSSALRLGAFAYLEKPLSITQIREILDKIKKNQKSSRKPGFTQ
jgi:DNA-binding NtrC family response regulator